MTISVSPERIAIARLHRIAVANISSYSARLIPKPTLLLSVDLCYPGCGDFTDIYTNNEFEDMIMKYTPCSADECTVTIVGESDVCTPCSNEPSRNLRFLQDSGSQSSAITFEIESTTPLNEQVVTENLNDSISEANDELEQDGVDFYVSGNYKEATKVPTKQPTKKPSQVRYFVNNMPILSLL